MADDQTFRLILALGMAAFLPVALYHRIRSQAGGEKLDRRQEGLFILVTLHPADPRPACRPPNAPVGKAGDADCRALRNQDAETRAWTRLPAKVRRTGGILDRSQ